MPRAGLGLGLGLGRTLTPTLTVTATLNPNPNRNRNPNKTLACLEEPLGFARTEELVDDALRRVGEVSELRLPHDQRVGRVERVAWLGLGLGLGFSLGLGLGLGLG